MIGLRTGTDPRVWLSDPDMLATAMELLEQAGSDQEDSEEVD